MKHEDHYYRCPTCQEEIDYDSLGASCEKCEWWEEEGRREQDRYERLMWEREEEAKEWERLYGDKDR